MEYNDLAAANKQYERGMRVQGRKKFYKKIEPKITPDGTVTPQSVQDRPAHFIALQDVEPIVSEGLAETLRVTRAKLKGGRPPMWLAPLSTVKPEVLAYIGLLCCFNGALKKWTLNNLTQRVGEMVEQELLLSELMAAEDAKTNKRIIKQVTEAHSSREVRMKALRNITMKNGFRSLNFGLYNSKKEHTELKKRRINYSGPVLDAVLTHCTLFEKVTEFEGRNNSISRIILTDEAHENLEYQEESMSWMSPLFKPMLEPPTPWTAFDTGCYKDPKLSSKVQFVRQATTAQRRAIEHDFKSGIPTYAKAVNALQATPLSINRPLLEIVQWCWDNSKTLEKFPVRQLPERPKMPANHDSLSKEHKAAIKADIRRHFVLERQVKGGIQVMSQELETAYELSEHDQFYLPVNLDFRSRLYFVSTFNYHREDWLKSLFTYQRGYRVDGNNAYWLMVHLANCGDFDKISKRPLDERVQWVTDNHDQIIACAENFVESYHDWSRADKPFCFMAAVLEYARYCKEGEDFVCYIPLCMDGTNSGVQHYAGLNLSEREGLLVNLLERDEMEDIYRLNAEEVVKVLTALKGSTKVFNEKWDGSRTVGQLAQVWLDFGVDRKCCKRSGMTFGYGSKANGMSGQFMEDFIKPLQRKVDYKQIDKNLFGDTEREQFEAARFMGGLCYEAIRQTLPDTTSAMDYLQGVAKVLTEEGKPVSWRTPSGFPVVQQYHKTETKRAKIFLFDRALQARREQKVGYMIEQDKYNVQKSMNAIAPNFVHGSGDASHMQLTICHMLDEDLADDFFCIHDSFSISGDMWDLFHGVRHTFVEMYNGDCVFQAFENEIRQQLNDPTTELPPIPPKGTLDIEQVRQSQFCFS